uniref:STB6-like N-terminal domain-containing protein n=1 Tax=Kwoniella dejecticola CBS 10117 TaxID=1296121 RepID=A0A1A6ABP8_9TREE|nr:uncharacterized protein I303_01697 [Kwoniella dejecticola CBS 10117]OBR87491.1 hypothetical protein I303_01697 [Kwoniella dejecticola CBS 10117]
MSFTLSPTSISNFSPSPSTPSRFSSPVPSPSSAAGPLSKEGLLIPTDRPLDELEEKWLGKLGRLKVEKEVTLQGYALYSLRSWFLSRTHFSHTIVTQTGKPTEQISAYLLVPVPSLSPHEASFEIANAIQFLASETQSSPRKTEYGTLLVTTPSAFGQEVNPVPGGDFRVAKPYTTVNTGLRRLGCGGRAVIGMESPIPALRRKFHELYQIPQPTHPFVPLSRNNSPSASPKDIKAFSSSPLADGHAQPDITSDPFTFLVIELVKLIQASLALWGLFGNLKGAVEIDGLFCDETKAGIFQWRRIMGMEHEESLKLEKETSGGCIDPKTLSALLSSVTSVHYELDALDVEKLPKDPFSNHRRFLNTWTGYQACTTSTHESMQYLTVGSIRALTQHYLADRTRHHGDALKVHRLLFNGVASATSSISANLKGGSTEDTPIRKREHHLRFRDDEEGDQGVGLIIPEGEVGPVAPPDVITTDLDAYIKGILRSREKDWDIMGARRVAQLWNGSVAENDPGRKRRNAGRMGSMNSSTGSMRDPSRGVLRKRTQSKDFVLGQPGNGIREDDEEGDLKGALGRAGQAIKGGFGLVSRRGTNYETSDSETGGPGPSSLKSTIMRKRQSTVPLLIEPGYSASPSPSASHRLLDSSFKSSSKPSFLTATSRAPSKRPSIITQVSGNESDIWSRASLANGLSPTEERSDMEYTANGYSPGGHSRTPSGKGLPYANASANGNGRPGHLRTASDRAVAWRERGRATTMLRTASDGADVVVEETGMEWEVTNPHGTGKRDGDVVGQRSTGNILIQCQRSRILGSEHLQVDVEMCAVVLDLREREKELSRRAKDVKTLEESVFQSLSQFVTSAKSRRSHVEDLTTTSEGIRKQIESLDVDDEHDNSNSPADRFHYYLSEETHRPELLDDLGRLKEMWEGIRRSQEEKRRAVDAEIDIKRDGSKAKWWNWW